MGVAADRLAAVAVIGQQFRLVANADLPHFDPGLQRPLQRLDECPEIDSVFGKVVDHDAFAAEQPLDIDQLHGERQFGDLPFADAEVLFAGQFEPFGLRVVLREHFPKDLAAGGIGELGDGVIGRFAQDISELQSARSAGHDASASAVRFLPREKDADHAGRTVTNHVFRHATAPNATAPNAVASILLEIRGRRFGVRLGRRLGFRHFPGVVAAAYKRPARDLAEAQLAG